MSLPKITKNLPGIFSELLSFYFYKIKSPSQNSGKIIYIDLLKPNLYSRYLYLLIKFFHIEGYTICLPNNLSSYRKICNSDVYLQLILKENIVKFKTPSEKSGYFKVDKEILSPEYFEFLIEKSELNTFHIPMSMHPLIYHKNIWDLKLKNFRRKKSVFMIGNFDKQSYSSLEFSLFEVISRTEIWESLENNEIKYRIKSQKELQDFCDSEFDEKWIIIDRNDFSIKPEDLRKTLSQFYFFLACPGIVIPHSHNLIEALSVGCIPIIQDKYAQLLHPPLKHMKNALIFSNLNDLDQMNQLVNSLNIETLQFLQKNVDQYYEQHLTPSAVVKKILKKNYSRLYLQAEFDSVRHLKLQKAYKKVGKPKPKYT